MAEEDESAKSGAAPDHGGKPSETSPPIVHPASPITDIPERSRRQSEWTASDSRGPLMAADDEAPAIEPTDHADLTDHSPPVGDAPADPIDPPHGETQAQHAPTTVAAAPEPRSAWPIAAGLVAGAFVGAVVALWVYPTVHSAPDPELAKLSSRVAALEGKPSPQAAIEPLAQRVAALEKNVGGPPQGASTSPRTAAFDPAPLDQKIAALGSRVDTLQQQGAATQTLGTKVSGLEASLAGIANRAAGIEKQAAGNDKSLQEVEDQQKTIQDQQKTIQDRQKNLEGKVGTPALAVVSASLVQQITIGEPYAMQVDALASLGADPVKLGILKQNAASGVASPKVLAASFAPLAEPILSTEHKAPPNASFMDRMKSGLGSLVSIRRADEVGGDDLSSRVARIQADLQQDDLGDALATWTLLPDDAKAKGAAWAARLKTSAEALKAARDLQSEAIAAMGAKKS